MNSEKTLSPELQKKCQHYRISGAEYFKISELLGHPPSGIEWALFSALWSEHCSYKSSKIHLRKFSYKNLSVLESEGENAGVIDLGFGEKIAFKMESHNHPSFIEPFQGAATGVGGILRDIFTMGARPIALADYLCFGDIEAPRMKSLVQGVVSGISSYGNCVGVPTVTGQTVFHSSYNNNILVNAMAVGLITEEMKMARSKATGPGNWVVYVGARTGKDGVHGASMASESFDSNNEAKKPNVQIGDPFFEKLLIESCLEILDQDLVVAMQDMGAAGLTSSSFEMSSKGQVGITLHLDQVPLRDATMTPEEILLSESQERMLLVCRPENFENIQKVFSKWDLEAQKIGEVKKERTVDIFWKGEKLVSIDPDLLVENAPRYEREYEKWSSPNKEKFKASILSDVQKHHPLDFVLKSPESMNFCSREWIYKQYDQRVGAKTCKDAKSSVAFIKLPSGRGLSITLGCRPSVMRLDSFLGGQDAVFFPALQMAVKGAQAMAVTDCLNFGNPEKLNVMSEFVASVEGLAEAAKALDAPVISGNVSFYNETQNQNITSTPATGLIGLRKDVEDIPDDVFTAQSQVVYWLRSPWVESLHSELLISHQSLNVEAKAHFDGRLDSEQVAGWIKDLSALVNDLDIAASKVVGDGGLFETLRRMSLGKFGFRGHQKFFDGVNFEKIFSETFYEAVLVVDIGRQFEFQKSIEKLCQRYGSQVYEIGWAQEGLFEIPGLMEVKTSELLERHQIAWRLQ
jgi:phosphoribosylformylglycinamidine synthase II